MGRFLIVSKAEQLEEYMQVSKDFDVAFELNDFFDPDVLEREELVQERIAVYKKKGIPAGSTMHGAFLDVVVFSQDPRIRSVSEYRMEQSMRIADQLGVRGVVFHTNANPLLESVEYDRQVITYTVALLKKLLMRYPGINIYLENMFDRTPDILTQISEQLCEYSNYGVCFDYAHASVYGESVSDWVERIAPYIRHLHVNDNDLKHDLHWAVGDGKIDWKRFEAYYRRYFSDCSILIETTAVEKQRRSIEYIKRQTRLMEMEG